MNPFRPLSAIEQLAAYLRSEIQSGALGETLPGVHRLAKELGVSPKSVVAAVAQLEHEGLLSGQGARRSCRITPPLGRALPTLRVSMLLYEGSDRMLPYVVDLEHQFKEAGHVAGIASRSLVGLGRDLERVAGFVQRNETDAWVVFSGTREILEWFAARPGPAFALFGRRRGVPIAGTGPDKLPAVREVVRRLVALGHQKIVLLVREERRKPNPGAFERAFLDELAAHGIPTGNYHLPDWEETPEGFRHCLDRLFATTPPTALVLDEAFFLTVAQQHLARRRILAPEHVSLICCDPDPSFLWFLPRVAHIGWDSRPVVRRILRWANNIAHGKDDRRQSFTKAEFIEGGTVGTVAVAK